MIIYIVVPFVKGEFSARLLLTGMKEEQDQ